MNTKQTASQPAPGLTLGDIYYVLFRRKWLILGVASLGIAAAIVTYFCWHLPYESTAELLIGGISELSAPDQVGGDRIKSPDDRGANILNSETAILTSLNSAKKAAAFVGPARILPKAEAADATNIVSIETNVVEGVTNVTTNYLYESLAASLIQMNLRAEPGKQSDVIYVMFSHPDRNVVVPVLDQIITNYINKHTEIYRKFGQFDQYYTTEKEMLGSRLRDLDTSLAKMKNDAGIIDVAEALRTFTTQGAAISQEYEMAQVALAGATAEAAHLKAQIPAAAGATNVAAASSLTPVSSDTIAQYNEVRQKIATVQTELTGFSARYTDANAVVKAKKAELAAAQAARKALEDANPGLLAAAPVDSRQGGVPMVRDPVADYNDMMGKVGSIQARITVLTNQLQMLQSKGTNLNKLEADVSDLERNRQMDEERYRQISSKANEVQIDQQIGASRLANINVIQSPSPPAQDMLKLIKVTAGIALGGIVLAFGLAFLLELGLDHTLKRPQEVAARIKLPFFLTLPYMNGNGKLRLPKADKKAKLLPAASGEAKGATATPAPAPAGDGPIAPWDEKHALRPFHETLRDRLVAYFEMINLTHKPKLVAVTSCAEGAGVSTIASGLASSLSETGDGNVLLVNMNVEDGEAHHFYKGKLAMGLDDVLQKEKRESAMVQDNLYVVKESTNRDKLPTILPKRFGHLVDKMKASDYDYIIFDMPPVTQVSVTPRLARFMDMILLVVEAQKTDRDVADRAAALLSESRANVGVVMNKARSYVPRRLHQEL